jgi:lipocalin
MNQQNRICIYPKDIVRITGKSERYGRKLIEKIKAEYSKREDQFISVEEFCQYTGLKIEQVQPFLIG